MLCRLHGEVDSTHFKSNWIPLAHGVLSAGIVYNRASNVSVNIMKALEKVVTKSEGHGVSLVFFWFSVRYSLRT